MHRLQRLTTLLCVAAVLLPSLTASADSYLDVRKGQAVPAPAAYSRVQEVTLTADGDTLTLRNTGAYPAVGAFVEDLSCDTAFTVSDNFLLLEPGEERTLRANRTRGASVRGFNFPMVTA